MSLTSPRVGKTADTNPEKKDKKKKLLLLGSSTSDLAQTGKMHSNSPSPIRRAKISRQKYPTLNSPISLSFEDATSAAESRPRGAVGESEHGSRESDDKDDDASGMFSPRESMGIIGRLRSFSIDRASTGEISPRLKISPKKKGSFIGKKNSKEDGLKETKTRKNSTEANASGLATSTSSRALLQSNNESISEEFTPTLQRGKKRRKQLSQILEGLDVAGMSQWDDNDEAWQQGTRGRIAAFKARNKIEENTRANPGDSSGSGSDDEHKKTQKKLRKKEEKEKKKREKALEREKRATLKRMKSGRKRGHTRSGSEISGRSFVSKAKTSQSALMDDRLDSPTDLSTRAMSGVTICDLSPRGAHHMKTGDEWWREELKKRGQQDRPPIPSSSGEEGTARPRADSVITFEPELLSSEERKLRAQEVEEYNKKLQEDQKNRRHRVLDLLTEWEQHVLNGDDESLAGAEDGAVVEDRPIPRILPTPRLFTAEEPRLSSRGSPEDVEESQPLPQGTQHATESLPARVIGPSAVSFDDIGTMSQNEASSVENADRQIPGQDVLEIEITRQDPTTNSDGSTKLVETKKMTIQLIIKRRDPSGPGTILTIPGPQRIRIGSSPHDANKGDRAMPEEATQDRSASEAEGETEGEEEELFFSQENEAILVSTNRVTSLEEEPDSPEDGGEETFMSAQEQLDLVEKEIAEKMRAMASLRREIKKLKARREGFIRASRRMSESRGSQTIAL